MQRKLQSNGQGVAFGQYKGTGVHLQSCSAVMFATTYIGRAVLRCNCNLNFVGVVRRIIYGSSMN